MRLKLDENLPHDLAEHLRDQGHEVHTVVDENLGGRSDAVVVAAASGEDRMLLTLDRGIGDVRRYPPGSHTGIVVLRPEAQDPTAVIALVLRFLMAESLEGLRGSVTIVEPDRIRIRRSRPADS